LRAEIGCQHISEIGIILNDEYLFLIKSSH
jgi:hypothetical protein